MDAYLGTTCKANNVNEECPVTSILSNLWEGSSLPLNRDLI